MIYAFEEIGPDLRQPPLAARRALIGGGVSMPQNTWAVLGIDARRALVDEGLKEVVDGVRVQTLVSPVLKSVRLMGPVRDPSRDSVPDKVRQALAGIRPISDADWSRLRPLDRYALNVLSANSRLLWKAIAELGSAGLLGAGSLQTWAGILAHCELRALPQVLAELAAGRVQDGKAIVVARAAGLRAARSASDTLDGYADKTCGPIELDARVDPGEGVVVWQAHVSDNDGQFFASASLLAATTAAVALRDAIAGLDVSARLADGGLREEAWNVGSGGFGEDATVATYDARAVMAALEKRRRPQAEPTQPSMRVREEQAVAAAAPAAAPAPPPARSGGVPLWMLVAMLIVTLLSLGSAVVALLLKRPL